MKSLSIHLRQGGILQIKWGNGSYYFKDTLKELGFKFDGIDAWVYEVKLPGDLSNPAAVEKAQQAFTKIDETLEALNGQIKHIEIHEDVNVKRGRDMVANAA